MYNRTLIKKISSGYSMCPISISIDTSVYKLYQLIINKF